MDPVILACVGITVAALLTVGAALLVAPARCTRAVNEWYVVIPAVAATNPVGLLVCRAAGVGLVIGAVALGASTLHLVAELQ